MVATTADITDTERLRRRHLAEARRVLPEHLDRLSWPAERIRVERRSRLRALIAVAKAGSPWHRRRLAHLDPDTLEEADLLRVPPMTKDDLMTHFDEIVTDSRLTLDLVETHLATAEGEAYLFGRYHAVASSGSSGRRGVFVHDWDAWTTYYMGCFRYLLRQRLAMDAMSAGPTRMAAVAAGRPTHMSAATFRTFSDPSRLEMHRFPVTLPLAEIVAGLGAVQPQVLSGYPTAVHQLALEARAGRLRIAPEQVVVYGEPLLAEQRRAFESVWGVPVHNWWGTSEGNVLGASCGEGPGLHLHDDLFVVEPVRADGSAAPVGERSAGVLLTVLRNPVLPLIRYEISDEITVLDDACPCGSGARLIDDVHGRAEEGFRYPGLGLIHPHVFRSRLGAEPGISEYQVVQTAAGADVFVTCAGPVDLATVGRTLTADLRGCGLLGARVTLTQVGRLDRGGTGKLTRFVPLSAISGPTRPAMATGPAAAPEAPVDRPATPRE